MSKKEIEEALKEGKVVIIRSSTAESEIVAPKDKVKIIIRKGPK